MSKEINPYYYHVARIARQIVRQDAQGDSLATQGDLERYRIADDTYSFDPRNDDKVSRWISKGVDSIEKKRKIRDGSKK